MTSTGNVCSLCGEGHVIECVNVIDDLATHYYHCDTCQSDYADARLIDINIQIMREHRCKLLSIKDQMANPEKL